jgi:hypothetical protein
LFGEKLHSCYNVIIKNGHLGKTSHHSIHSPGYSKNIILYDLTIEEFAVGAIHLNGAHNVYMNNISIDNKNMVIKFNSLLSQSQFILPFLEQIDENEIILLEGVEKSVKTIKTKIRTDIDNAFKSIREPELYPYSEDNIFYNKDGLDANMYGIVLNTNGIAVNDLKPLKTDNSIGNNNIVLRNVSVKNIVSKGSEVLLLSTQQNAEEAYGKGGFTGPVGDVFDFIRCKDANGYYKGNCLSDAQLTIAKFLPNTRTNIPKAIIEWADGTSKIQDIIENEKYYVIRGRDSMAHVMKGNIGIFCSQTYRMILQNIIINNVRNNSISDYFRSNYSAGLLFTGCIDVLMRDYIICNITSENGLSDTIAYKNENKNIITVYNSNHDVK